MTPSLLVNSRHGPPTPASGAARDHAEGRPVTVIYLVGHGYSGSTLLTFLLGSHPEVATVGEVVIAPGSKGNPSALTCSCGLPFHGCPFWARVSEEMAARGIPFDVHDSELDFRLHDGGLADVALRASLRGPLLELVRSAALAGLPRARRALGLTLGRYEAFASVVTGLKGCRTFLDASKRAERALHLRRSRGLDLRIIHLIRDGRAVAASAMKHLGWSAAAAAAAWVADNTECERARRYFPADRWLKVRHEDVCADPAGALARIHAFAGIAVRPEIGNFRQGQHVIGNNMRLASTTEIVLDERWRSTLARSDLAAIERRAGEMNLQYGYDPSGP